MQQCLPPQLCPLAAAALVAAVGLVLLHGTNSLDQGAWTCTCAPPPRARVVPETVQSRIDWSAMEGGAQPTLKTRKRAKLKAVLAILRSKDNDIYRLQTGRSHIEELRLILNHSCERFGMLDIEPKRGGETSLGTGPTADSVDQILLRTLSTATQALLQSHNSMLLECISMLQSNNFQPKKVGEDWMSQTIALQSMLIHFFHCGSYTQKTKKNGEPRLLRPCQTIHQQPLSCAALHL